MKKFLILFLLLSTITHAMKSSVPHIVSEGISRSDAAIPAWQRELEERLMITPTHWKT